MCRQKAAIWVDALHLLVCLVLVLVLVGVGGVGGGLGLDVGVGVVVALPVPVPVLVPVVVVVVAVVVVVGGGGGGGGGGPAFTMFLLHADCIGAVGVPGTFNFTYRNPRHVRCFFCLQWREHWSLRCFLYFDCPFQSIHAPT